MPRRSSPVAAVAAAAAVVAGCVVVAGCTGEDLGEDAGPDPPGTAASLLTQDEVPGALSAEDVATLQVWSVCGPVTRSASRLDTLAGSSAVREIHVETPAGPTTVSVAVYEGMSAATRQTMIFAGLEQGIELCTRDSPRERGAIRESMTSLAGLPEGAVGYRSQITDQGKPEIVESAFADVNGTVLVVQARHAGDDDETGVDILELLAAAIDKAERG